MLQLLSLIITLALTCSAAEVPASQLVANQYVDALLSGFPEFARQMNLDPMALPSEKVGFSKKVGFVKVKGSASYSGSLRGLSTLHRSGDFVAGREGSRGFIDGTSMGLNNVQGSYTGRASFMKIGVSLKATAKVSTIRMRIRVSCDLAPGAVARLDNFNITTFSKINLSISGLGSLGWILGKLLGAITNSFRSKIVRAIEGPIRSSLASQVKKVAFPKL